jgi:surfactin synthase thioesterase subunit
MSLKAELKVDFSPPKAISREEPAAAGIASRWVKGLRENPEADTIRLFCFPFAGGGASAYTGWTAYFPHNIRVCPIQYPGREDRWGEPGFDTLESLVETMADDLAPHWHGRFAFLGHSFGALVAFELARVLHRRGLTTPARLFISAVRAPQLPPKESIHELPEQDFLDKLCEFNGMPDAVMQSPELLLVVLPIIRKDFRLFEQYRFQSAEPIPIPISVFGGLKDENVPVADLLAWSGQTSKAFRSRFLEGHHFFLFESQSKVVSYIVEDLEAAAGNWYEPAGLGEMIGGARYE